MIDELIKSGLIDETVDSIRIDDIKHKMSRNLNVVLVLFGMLTLCAIFDFENMRPVLDFKVIPFVMCLVLIAICLLLRNVNNRKDIDDMVIDGILIDKTYSLFMNEKRNIKNKYTKNVGIVDKVIINIYMVLLEDR